MVSAFAAAPSPVLIGCAPGSLDIGSRFALVLLASLFISSIIVCIQLRCRWWSCSAGLIRSDALAVRALSQATVRRSVRCRTHLDGVAEAETAPFRQGLVLSVAVTGFMVSVTVR